MSDLAQPDEIIDASVVLEFRASRAEADHLKRRLAELGRQECVFRASYNTVDGAVRITITPRSGQELTE